MAGLESIWIIAAPVHKRNLGKSRPDLTNRASRVRFGPARVAEPRPRSNAEITKPNGTTRRNARPGRRRGLRRLSRPAALQPGECRAMNGVGIAGTLFITQRKTTGSKTETTLTSSEQNDDDDPCPYQRTWVPSPNRSPRKPTWLRTLALAGWRVSAFARAGVCSDNGAILGALSSRRYFDDKRARMYTHDGTTEADSR